MKKVEVNQGLLIGLIAVAGLAALGLMFLLGRETARPKGGIPVPAGGTVGSETRADAASPVVADVALRNPNVSMEETSGNPSMQPGLSVPSPLPSSNVADIEATRAAVVSYFHAVDRIQPGDLSGDSNAMANEIVGSLLKGDASGFDNLAKQAATTRDKLAALKPPVPCAAHHQESLALLNEELSMMQAMKKVLDSSNPGEAATELTNKSNALRARTEALQAKEKALRQKYGANG